MQAHVVLLAILGGSALGALTHWEHPLARIVGAMLGATVGAATTPLVGAVLRDRNPWMALLLLYLPPVAAARLVAPIAQEAAILTLGLVLAALGIGAGLSIGFVATRGGSAECCVREHAGARAPAMQAACSEKGANPPWTKLLIGVLSASLAGAYFFLCPIVIAREERRQNPRTCEEAMVAVMSNAIVIRERGLRILFQCGNEAIADAAARTTSWDRFFILDGLRQISPALQARDLIALAESERPTVRAGALLMLERIDHTEAMKLARETMDDDEEMVRSIAREVLRRGAPSEGEG